MRPLAVRWQRLVDEEGRTCDRCGSTEKEIEGALRHLRESLAPLGIEVTLDKRALDPVTCARDVSQSNRIWIGEKAMEEWLGGEVGKSPCGFCCEELGDGVECRTVRVGDRTYEAVPAELIVKAGLLAASQLLEVPPADACCPAPGEARDPASSCRPKPTDCRKECGE
jgi:hypothetical protein